MAVVAQTLVKGATLTSNLSSIFAAGAGTTVASGAVVANPTGATASLSVTLQRADGSSFIIVPGRAIAAGGTDLVPELARVLNAGDVIQASGAGLNIVIDGYLLS
ncbi:hypothetical protein [Asaia prunellae]|uniref:hypothetical protein n=1 Tax=Asaia prunellae TaxID=610245 RepID=UPI000471853E|nr:hypothetical protein [Asaia prunellae]